MIVDDVKQKVEIIRKMADDDEIAHSNEDGLHREVLAAIAGGDCADPAGCARGPTCCAHEKSPEP